ncbi:hypothetical protein [Thioalkalivibrio sp.]|uniref:hypothetical protein n=1 Tax=Thioalkalivibrio sp. TaxID=2093813 RepID=UPI0035615982
MDKQQALALANAFDASASTRRTLVALLAQPPGAVAQFVAEHPDEATALLADAVAAVRQTAGMVSLLRSAAARIMVAVEAHPPEALSPEEYGKLVQEYLEAEAA